MNLDPTMEAAILDEMDRMKSWCPFRLIWVEIKPDRSWTVRASYDRRQMRKSARAGNTVAQAHFGGRAA